MGEDDILIFKTLKWLAKKAESDWDRIKMPKFQTVRSYVASINVINEGELRKLEKELPSGNLTWDAFVGKCFLLPCPVKSNQFVPTLYVSFGGVNSGITMGHYLFGEGDDEGASFGVRYEEPHSDGDGMHDYYHAQFVNTVRDVAGDPTFTMQLPDSSPAFPLHAKDKLELFFSCLVSIYGKRIFTTYMREISQDKTVAKDQPGWTMFTEKMKNWTPVA